ncbi:hypothetical protein QZH41_007374 [Actinostola sp. cb2023]|nr:hypothetical protein QZH41_007374 [Actinostola sp. cb2023]
MVVVVVGSSGGGGSSGDLTNTSDMRNHVMISYQWDVQKTMIQLKNRLQAAGFRVWIDLEQMGGSTLEAMARAVEDSAVVLVCVSQKYKESSNCRSEAEYAFQLKKDIVPLMMEGNYRPDGWLGINADVVDAAPSPKIDITGWTNKDVMNWISGFGLEAKNYANLDMEPYMYVVHWTEL